MVEDVVSLFEKLLKNISLDTSKGGNAKDDNSKEDNKDKKQKDAESSLKEILQTLLGKAGNSKNAIVATLGREMGLALASVLKEPLDLLFNHNKLRFTIELVPKNTKSKNSKPQNSKPQNNKTDNAKEESK